MTVQQIVAVGASGFVLLWSLVGGLVLILGPISRMKKLRVNVGQTSVSSGTDDPYPCSMKEILLSMYEHQLAHTDTLEAICMALSEEKINGEMTQARKKLAKAKENQSKMFAEALFNKQQEGVRQ